MFNSAIKILKMINDKGYEAYIVGGYVRDVCLSKESKDIDISTNATPKELSKIFKENAIFDEKYGLTKVFLDSYSFEITTYRKDYLYLDNRKPSKIEFVKTIKEDLKRRDFIINTMYMDKNSNIYDLYNAKKDLKKKIIRTVNNPNISFKEDSLRILRAIRFATTLNFKLDRKIIKSIKHNSYLIENLSYTRKKEELERILSNDNFNYGIRLINKLKLYNYLKIGKMREINKTNDILGKWAQIDFDNNYPFTKEEKEKIEKIRKIVSYGKINNDLLYKYGLNVSLTASEILNLNRDKVLDDYNSLQIKSKDEIKLSILDISNLLDVKPSEKVKEIYNDLENKIVNNNIKNNKKDIKEFIINNYGG